MWNDLSIYQVFYIHIKFPDIHVKTAFPYQCNYAYIKPTFFTFDKNFLSS